MSSDGRAQEVRVAHEASLALGERAARQRERRNALMRRLRAEDPERWSYPRPSRAAGCSPELVAAIVKGRA